MSTQLEKLLEVVFEGVKKHGIPALIGADFNTKVEIIEKCLKKVFFHFFELDIHIRLIQVKQI